MPAFTVFAFGTKETSAKTKNIISQFSEACETEKVVIDGPKSWVWKSNKMQKMQPKPL